MFYSFAKSMHISSWSLIVFLRFIQMLIGLRETNDRIVAATFSALAVMVPILGADIVVGGERRKHFIEGRPKVACLLAFQFRLDLFRSSAKLHFLCSVFSFQFSTSDSLPPSKWKVYCDLTSEANETQTDSCLSAFARWLFPSKIRSEKF